MCRFFLRGVYSAVRLCSSSERRRWLYPTYLVACALLALVLPALGQNPNNAAAEKFTVTGTVVNSATGEPIPRALVTLQGSPSRTAFSDSTGAFSIDGVRSGRFSISAQKPGFFSQQQREGFARPPQFVDVGPKMESVTLRVMPESVVYGRLMDSNEQPVESVRVRLLRSVVRNGKQRLESRGYASSDEDGTFRFPNLQPGTYYLSAGPEAARPNSAFTEAEKPRSGWPGLYYPGVPDLASAAPIRVSAGQQVQADLTMNLVPLYSVSGMVSGFVPGQGVNLQVLNPSGDSLPIATQFSSETGVFDLRVPAGMYRLRAMGQSGEQQLRADLHINVNKDLTQLHLAMQPAATIQIHARMEDMSQSAGSPNRRSGYRANYDLPPVSVQLVASDPTGNDAYATLKGERGNRALVFQNVEPGRYTAIISAHGDWYVESATCGNTNLLTEELVVGSGGGCTMELLLRNDSGTLTLTVKMPGSASSDSQSSGVTVLQPTGGKGQVRSIPFNTGGQPKSDHVDVVQVGIAPGEYVVYVFDGSDAVQYSNAEALRPYSSQATTVTISPGQNTKATVPLIQTGSDAP